ncbi:MAG: hypothetical protein LN569_01260 [Rickettsia endosymbiont of Labidopullus appendiculatus]|nr:hypothetical protein [Rickettsia endosymbiont of Labidopullus appendiculatus]
MGIFIELKIVPNKINVVDWNSTYDEAKQLINSYPFLDAVGDDSYGCSWTYAVHSSEIPIQYCNNNLGFRMLGDLVSMEMAESFELIKDLNYYRFDDLEKNKCEDVLQLYESKYREHDGVVDVFHYKTQGYDYHQYILAIACLFEDRLKPYALAEGDISKGQIQAAIEWANNILKKPIQMSERANNEILLARIQKFESDELTALGMFMKATLNAQDYQLGCFIRANFSKESLIKHYVEKMSYRKVGTFGFSNLLDEYLNLGNDLRDLCDMCINKDNNVETIDTFIRQIFALGIHLKPDDITRQEQEQLAKQSQLQSDNPHSRTPDTVGSLFAKFFSVMGSGNKHQSGMYMPLDEIVEIFKEKFRSICDIDTLINKHLPKLNEEQESSPKNSTVPSLIKHHESNEIIERYDIKNLSSLIFWEPGFTIEPRLEQFIVRTKEFTEKGMSEYVNSSINALADASHKDRMKYLINRNKHFIISKKSWDYIALKVNDFNFFSRVAKILFIDAGRDINIHRLCLTLLNNTMLFEKYIMGCEA